MDAPSLLSPPNPAADPVKPQASILLNAPGRPPASPSITPHNAAPLDSPSISGSSLQSTSTGTSNGNPFFSSDSSQTSIPHSSPPLPSSARHPSPAPSHTSSFSSQQGSGGYYPASMTAPGSPSLGTVNRRTSTPKISFAPLPTVPPEFRRRNSISLGVASRRNLIGAQNGLPPGVQKHSGVHSVIMNDEEWEEYQRQYHERKGNDGVVDVGQLAKSGAKALWRSVKRRRSSSQTSQASQASTDSASTNLSNAQSAGSGTPSGVSQQGGLSTKPGGAGETMSSLHTVEEDDEHHSPPPGPAADLVRDDSGAQPLHAPLAKRPRSPGVKLTKEALAAEGLDDGDGEGGEATPRRRPSPPPRLADKLPTADELAEGREEEEEDEDEDDYEDSSVGYEEEQDELSTVEEKEDISAHAHHHALHEHHDHEHESHEERDRDRKASVLGFDVERFGLMEIGEQQHRGRR
ncbi:hypothetical protein L202_08324 [Cryptococcus amylolentus CBS 6039]|uniref:Uncharacterized protein n=2 Tax=Cryptococcus amylolentus TaxID=104669 RepID=A0A1E3H9T5_9TREE|nr:hypothetical protein L202_08324 [Cryptococcus amylolentus CBS 6039]ODN72905.1 hypothetical protein L202_08324 [Cryptococcus amylolentus CBS 6039]ODN98086.1 hypothetical protein I350_07728 [Cryptococcus amylolentus CBS 6273]